MMKNLLLLSSLLGGFTPLTTALLESRATGFQLVTSKQLEGSTLNSNCQQVLQQTIQCDEYVANFRERGYCGSLDDSALTDSVCQATCERSLLNARRRLAAVCSSTPDLMPGYPVATLIETTVAGWNETCLKDKDTGKYCNGECALIVALASCCQLTSTIQTLSMLLRITRASKPCLTRSCAPIVTEPNCA